MYSLNVCGMKLRGNNKLDMQNKIKINNGKC